MSTLNAQAPFLASPPGGFLQATEAITRLPLAELELLVREPSPLTVLACCPAHMRLAVVQLDAGATAAAPTHKYSRSIIVAAGYQILAGTTAAYGGVLLCQKLPGLCSRAGSQVLCWMAVVRGADVTTVQALQVCKFLLQRNGSLSLEDLAAKSSQSFGTAFNMSCRPVAL
jgi:hypothetical protein